MHDRRCVQSVDEHCLALFDEWCERRAVLPLSRLMNVWPLASSSEAAIDRLCASLDELLGDEAAGLRVNERALVHLILKRPPC